MTPDKQKLLSLLLKKDFCGFAQKVFHTLNPTTPYAPGWHIAVIAEWLAGFQDGSEYRLIINLPPRHLKSLLGSIALPAWLLGQGPSSSRNWPTRA